MKRIPNILHDNVFALKDLFLLHFFSSFHVCVQLMLFTEEECVLVLYSSLLLVTKKPDTDARRKKQILCVCVCFWKIESTTKAHKQKSIKSLTKSILHCELEFAKRTRERKKKLPISIYWKLNEY